MQCRLKQLCNLTNFNVVNVVQVQPIKDQLGSQIYKSKIYDTGIFQITKLDMQRLNANNVEARKSKIITNHNSQVLFIYSIKKQG
jgi:hypothetical protein